MSGPFGSQQWMYNASSGFYPYELNNSLKFEDGDSSYLSRTPSSAGNRKTWTWSGWVKRGNMSVAQYVFFAYNGNSDAGFFRIEFNSTNTLRVRGWGTTYLETSALYRDASAWYHIVLVADTTQSQTSSTASDSRIRLYVNGEQVTAFSSASMPSQNTDLPINNNITHNLSSSTGYLSSSYFDGYLSNVHFIDGQALDASSFGETKEGIWIPKDPTGLTYGTNGFHLDFNGNTNDTSGNGNDWTANNISAHDYVPDTPTDGFAVLNGTTSGGVGTLTEGNLVYQGASSQWESKISTIGVSSGKWYYEVSPISGSSTQGIFFGITNTSDTYLNLYLGYYGNTWGYYGLNGQKYNNSTALSYGAAIADGDVVGVALDADAGTLTFYKNGVSQGVAYSGLSLGGSYDQEWFLGLSCYGTAKAAINFGQDSSFSGRLLTQGNADDNGKGDFYYAPPSEHLALCNANLPDPAIDPNAGDNSENYFNTVLYTGNGSTQSITGVGFQPDFLWTKQRNGTNTHALYDVVRVPPKVLYSSETNSEETNPAYVNQFDADGFTVGAANLSNASGGTYVAWNWLAGGTAVSNTDGTITSSVSASPESGFSIVSYTTTATSSDTVGHGLSSAPELIFTKDRGNAINWIVFTTAIDGSVDNLKLNLTDAAVNQSGSPAITATTFTTNYAVARNTIAYCFHSVEGYSKFGSYTGNGSSDGTFVYTGFRPAWVMGKRTNTTSNWFIHDSKRSENNPSDDQLQADVNTSEYANNSGVSIDLLSNGFKLRNSSGMNGSGSTYIYMAFAEQPFKYANAR